MKVPLLDLTAQYAALREELDEAVARVVHSQRFVLGPVVEACEDAVARYVGARHGIGVSSGTDALLLALMAEGIGPGDEVVTTPFSFFATAGVISRVGARPVFADVDPVTLNIDPARVAERITDRTRAIIPVHLFGQMAEMTPLVEAARERGIAVIEDAAQAIGARHEGRCAGSVGDYGCFSFFPTKNLGGWGDGGLVVTNDAARAKRLRALRVHGETTRYHHRFVGGNFRLDALQAAVLLAKLPHLKDWTASRIANAALYTRLLGPATEQCNGRLRLPRVVTGHHVFNQYVIRVADRDRVRAELDAAGVGTAIYYPIPLHLQECFADLGYRPGDLPVSERAAGRVLALPVFPELTEAQIRHVATVVEAAVGAGGKADPATTPATAAPAAPGSKTWKARAANS